jgi:hypothetical protein
MEVTAVRLAKSQAWPRTTVAQCYSLAHWETERFQNLTFLHLKRERSASGFVYSNLFEGDIDYVTGKVSRSSF